MYPFTLHPGQRFQDMPASRRVLELVRKGYKFLRTTYTDKTIPKSETDLPHDQMDTVRKEVSGFLDKRLCAWSHWKSKH